MKIAVASDHAGFGYKEKIAAHLRAAGHEVFDFGTYGDRSVDYPDYILPAAEAVAAGQCERAIMLGGSGNGEAIAANRVRGVRCAYVWSVETAQLGRQHNNANAISLGQRVIDLALALAMVDTFLVTPFEGGRHLPRIEKLDRDREPLPLPSLADLVLGVDASVARSRLAALLLDNRVHATANSAYLQELNSLLEKSSAK